ncbi:MAG TPA: M3 family oligoendopeptidase [Candidatus Eisenbacteria bacterium]|nr:M3 family oligoendopeptidase [Candidatus Eisenbacteria bacterium]
MVEKENVWDLSQLVDSTEVAAVQKQLETMVREAEKIQHDYRSKIEGLDAAGLREFLVLKDAFMLRFEGPVKYCNLMYSADSTDEVAKQLSDAARRATAKADQALAFVEIELGKLLAAKPLIVKDPTLSEYHHYLERIIRKTPHMLSEIEERLTIIKDKNGINAWELLQSDWLSTRTFEMTIKGEKKTLPYGQIIGLYQSPDRNIRKQSNQIVYEGLGKDDVVWASAIRAVCEDHMQMCDLRKYPTPMTQSLIDNDVDSQTIESLLRTIEKNVNLYRRYLRLKAKLMGLEKLANYDVTAPLPKSPEKQYTWKDSRKEVVDAYTGFDSQIGSWADEMYEKRHFDGEVRKGKTSGAFCAGWLAGKSAYILQSFNGRMGDVYTQAHELGHAIHDYLMSRAQKPTNVYVGSCVAETGSIFGELLLTERLLTKAKSNEEKQAILASVLDEFGMAAFQVSARAFFEQSMYDAIKRGQFLDGETVAKLWVAARDKIYGDSVEWLDVMKWEWTMKLHYYMANYRFYNYPYVYAQLFVFALYKLYKEQGKSFVPKLKALLAAGSSKSPRELSKELGLDITDERFWEKGMRQAEEFITMLEKTMQEKN